MKNIFNLIFGKKASQDIEMGLAQDNQNSTWECPECQRAVSGDYCSFCGTFNPSLEWVCPRCGNTCAGNYCNNCGAVNPMRPQKCPKCGKLMTGKFCSHCGTALIAPSMPLSEVPSDNKGVQETPGLAHNTAQTINSVENEEHAADSPMPIMPMEVIAECKSVTQENTTKQPGDTGKHDVTDDISESKVALSVDCALIETDDQPFASMSVGNITVRELMEKLRNHKRVSCLASPDNHTYYIRDYIGLNLSSIGYTAASGTRFDRYGSGVLEIIPVTIDGEYVDIENEDSLGQYVVAWQSIMPNAEFQFLYLKDSQGKEYGSLIEFQNYDAIDLLVIKLNEYSLDTRSIYKPTVLLPAPDRHERYIRNYIGKNLASVGYTTAGGKRMDRYGAAYIELVFATDDFRSVNINDSAEMSKYIIVDQDVAPNTALKMTFVKDSKGNEYGTLVMTQTYNKIILTARRIAAPHEKNSIILDAPLTQEVDAYVIDAKDLSSTEEIELVSPKETSNNVVHEDGNITWTLDSSGILKIAGEGELDDWYEWENDKGIITTIVIGEGITALPYEAFESYTKLESVTLPSTLTAIGASAFWGCSRLTNLVIPGNVEDIGESAFYSSGLHEVKFEEGITELPDSIFESCKALKSVTLPSTLERIGSSTFWGCSQLTDLTIPGNVVEIGESAFYDTGLRHVTVEEGITELVDGMFESCKYLETVTLPSTLEKIGASAFWGCSKLTELTIPETVKDINDSAFQNCTNLKKIYYTGGASDWESIHIAYGNDYLYRADKQFGKY